jgi:hypothetical protein
VKLFCSFLIITITITRAELGEKRPHLIAV